MFGALFCFGVLFVKTTVGSFFGVFFLGPSWRENKQKTRFERETIMNRSSRKNGGKVIFMKLILSAAGPSKSEMGN